MKNCLSFLLLPSWKEKVYICGFATELTHNLPKPKQALTGHVWDLTVGWTEYLELKFQFAARMGKAFPWTAGSLSQELLWKSASLSR